MTREEAIDVIKCLAWHTRPNEEDIEQAIKALEQEPCDDAISRQAVEKITWEEPSYTDALNVLTEVRDKIRALPPVTPQPKTGHWRAIYQGEEIIDYRCTKCEFGNTFGKSTYRMNYCPNCGCHMIEPQESEE